jgi:hypothetical protein
LRKEKIPNFFVEKTTTTKKKTNCEKKKFPIFFVEKTTTKFVGKPKTLGEGDRGVTFR